MKTEQWFENFFVTYNNGKVVKVDACPGACIGHCARDVIKFLKRNNIDSEFILRFNDKKLKISRFSKVEDILKEYSGTKELGL
ncbi:MAG: hypothetical protein IJ458_00615 [Clostridia bacterium]|nr:hypothetical protein [Clostridia bacterium]MBQ8522151.1 hypothetical protein [Clostridia bacterium]